MSISAPPTEVAPAARGPRLAYLPALDGIRAISVLAVVAWHMGMARVPGGFLGVEVFFAISGYLITSLLLIQYRSLGHSPEAWIKRDEVVRYLPAVGVGVLATAYLGFGGLRGGGIGFAVFVVLCAALVTLLSSYARLAPDPVAAFARRCTVVVPVALVGSLVVWQFAVSRMRGGYERFEAVGVAAIFLIVVVQLLEQRNAPDTDFRGFYVRRTRRLFPALYVMIGLTVVYLAARLPDLLGALKGDVAAGSTYTTNWFQIIASKPYGLGESTPFEHLWSLAVEEQYYILWPTVMYFGLRRLGRRRLATVILCGGALSVLLMLCRFWFTKTDLGTLYFLDNDATPLYVSLVTRSSGLLIGAAFAFVWAPSRLTRRTGPWMPLIYDLVALSSLATLIVLFATTDFFTDRRFLYGQGGFLLVDVLTVLLIAAAVHPASHMRRVLGVAPLREIGARSYGIYLWQGPVIALTGVGHEVFDSRTANQITRLVLIAVLAELSYRYVEQPIRKGLIGDTVRRYRGAQGAERDQLSQRLFGGVAAGAVGVVLVLVLVMSASPATDLTGIAAGTPTTIDFTNSTFDLGTTTTSAGGGSANGGSASTRAPRPGSTTPTTSPPATAPQRVPGNLATRTVTYIGDSVMLGAANTGAIDQLVPGRAVISAEVSRAPINGVELIRQLVNSGRLGDALVVHLGTNGVFRAELFQQMMDIVGPDTDVFVLNTRVPRSWEAETNAILAEQSRRYPNVTFVDWHAAGSAHPEVFAADGYHVGGPGAQLYATLIRDAMLQENRRSRNAG